jgi:hypothetical protein
VEWVHFIEKERREEGHEEKRRLPNDMCTMFQEQSIKTKVY